MKYNELVKILKKKGWYLDLHGANHDRWRNDELKKSIIIGRHGKEEIKQGLYFKLKKEIDF